MENGGGVNSTMIYCKNFGKCYSVPLPSTTIKKNEKFLIDWFFFPSSTPTLCSFSGFVFIFRINVECEKQGTMHYLLSHAQCA
jgi:hypothetical protein